MRVFHFIDPIALHITPWGYFQENLVLVIFKSGPPLTPPKTLNAVTKGKN